MYDNKISFFHSDTMLPGSKLIIIFKLEVLPSAIVEGTVKAKLKVQYRRPSWTTTTLITVNQDISKIKSANFTGGSHISESSLLSADDHAVIAPGENITFDFKVTLPLASMSNFAVLVESDGAELVKSVVTAGSHVQTGSGPLQISGKNYISLLTTVKIIISITL